jgi:hypothetical protein
MQPWATPATIFLGDESSLSIETLNFLFLIIEAISLIRLVENFNSDYFYSRPGCHVVSKAFPIFKNTAGRRDPLALYIEISGCDVHESQTDLH